MLGLNDIGVKINRFGPLVSPNMCRSLQPKPTCKSKCIVGFFYGADGVTGNTGIDRPFVGSSPTLRLKLRPGQTSILDQMSRL